MNPPHNHEPQSAGAMITRQLLDHRVLPAAISYIARFTPDMATVVAQSVEVAAPGAKR